MKRVLFLWVVLLALTSISYGQNQDSLSSYQDLHTADSLVSSEGDTTVIIADSSAVPAIDTQGINPHSNVTNRLLRENEFVNSIPATSPEMPVSPRKVDNTTDIYFYTTCLLLLLLGIFRASNRGYIFSLFSVYFNTSLKQNQLTDRLIQAKLPSFILNVFFIIVIGTFAWQIIEKSGVDLPYEQDKVLFFSLAAVSIVYLSKYCFFKFFGWLSGFGNTISRYLFIVFLINKIIAIILIPFVVLLLFGKPEWADTLITIGLLSAGFLLLSRYIRGYVVLKRGFVVTPFHFLLFIAAVEVIPLLLIYKAITNYLVA